MAMTHKEQIEAAHPVRTGRHDLYQEAMRLVGERQGKSELVNLVNWLLARLDAGEVPDVLEMPAPRTVRVKGTVRRVYSPDFELVDDADDGCLSKPPEVII